MFSALRTLARPVGRTAALASGVAVGSSLLQPARPVARPTPVGPPQGARVTAAATP